MATGVDTGPFDSIIEESDVVSVLGGYLKVDKTGTPVYPGNTKIVYAREHNRVVGAISDIVAWVVTADGRITALEAGGAALAAETAARIAADAILTSGLAAELVARAAADSTLTTNLATEASTRASADSTLTTNLAAELVARAAADSTLATNLATESSTRASADTALSGRVTVLEAGSGTGTIDITAAPYSVVVGVSTAAQCVLNRTGIQAAHAYAKAQKALGIDKIVDYPLGEIFVSFAGASDYDTADSRILIDWPGARIRGKGKNSTIIRARSRKDTVGRRSTLADDTTASGRRSGALAGSVVTLGAGEAANFSNLIGAELYFSPNANGTSPRATTDVITLSSVSTGANTITLSDATEVTGFIANDYIFVKNRLTLTTVGDATNFLNSFAGSAECEVYASPNADGSSPRTGAAPVVRVNTSTGVLTLANTDAISGFVDGDYLFVNVGFNVFEHRMASDADTTVVYDMLIEGMTVDAEFYGASDNPQLTGEDPTGDVRTHCFYGNPALGGANAIPYKVKAVDCYFSDGWENVLFSGGTAASTTLEMVDCTTSGGRLGVFMSTGTTSWQGKTFIADRCDWLSTDPVMGSHNLYLNPMVSIMETNCKHKGTPAAKFGLQHWGSAVYGPKFCILTSNSYEGAGDGILGNEHGAMTVADCTWLNAGAAIQFRSSTNVNGGTVRKSGTSTAFGSYADCQYNAHIRIIGVDFDFGGTPGWNGIATDIPAKWVILGCTFTANPITQGAGEPVDATGSRCIQVTSTAYDSAQPTDVTIADCIANFNTTTGTADWIVIAAAVNIDIHDNKWKGRCPTGECCIRSSGTVAGNGRIRIHHNDINAYGGGGIKFTSTWSGTPNCVIERNDITTNNTGRDGIDMQYVNAMPLEIRGNKVNAVDAALLVSATVPALSITGGDNEFTGLITDSGNKQNLMLRRAINPTTATAATSVTLSANYDTVLLLDSGAVTIDTLLIGGATATQLAFDGAEITLMFTTGNITLGAGGNITATGGARTAGTSVRLKYFASLTKWVEL